MGNVWKKEHGKKLVQAARFVITRRLFPSAAPAEPDISDIPDRLCREKRGVFVTLQKNGTLRGCIGNIEPEKTVLEGVKENALHAAFDDSRFSPLAPKELSQIDISVSLLTRPEKIGYTGTRDLLARITPFTDGVIVEKGARRATFLPQVWDQLPDTASFLSQLCLKARLDAHAWQTGELTVYTYQVQSFDETGSRHDH